MKRTRICILTTEGASSVQSIVKEDPSLRAVICLDGRAEELAISGGYNVFVKSPTGIIEKRFGHPSYRIDVSRTISNGKSWQLGVLLAHGKFATDQLAMWDEPFEDAIFATGEVDVTGRIHAVDGIERKIETCASSIVDHVDSGVRVHIYFAEANAAEISDAIATHVSGRISPHARERLYICPLGSIDDLQNTIANNAEAVVRDEMTAPVVAPEGHSSARAHIVTAVGLLAMTALLVGLWPSASTSVGWANANSPTARDQTLLEIEDALTRAQNDDCFTCRLSLAMFDLMTAAGLPASTGRWAYLVVSPSLYGACKSSLRNLSTLAADWQSLDVKDGQASVRISDPENVCAIAVRREHKYAVTQKLVLAGGNMAAVISSDTLPVWFRNHAVSGNEVHNVRIRAIVTPEVYAEQMIGFVDDTREKVLASVKDEARLMLSRSIIEQLALEIRFDPTENVIDSSRFN